MNVVILNDGIGVRKVIFRINLRHEARRKELSIGTNAVKELFDVGEVSSGDVEMNVIAAESSRKRDILRGLQRFRLIEGQRARNSEDEKEQRARADVGESIRSITALNENDTRDEYNCGDDGDQQTDVEVPSSGLKADSEDERRDSADTYIEDLIPYESENVS